MLLLFLSGCGYTTKTVLPQGIKTIHVDTVKNVIPVDHIYAYEPGLEMKITNAIIRRLEKDGNLKVTDREHADAVLESKMTSMDQEGVRFSNLESIEEYRMFIVVSMQLKNAKTGAIIWEEPNFTGDADYFVNGNGVRSVARREAAERAIDRLARNVVDRVVEDW